MGGVASGAATPSAAEGSVRSVQPNVSSSGAMRSGFNAVALPGNDDGSTGLVPLPFPLRFFGHTYTSLYINNNGNLSFNSPLWQYTPQTLDQLSYPMIAPFWADVDTRVGNVLRYGTGTVNGHSAFGVTWPSVGCYSMIGSTTNAFQVILVSRPDTGSGNFDIEFNYGSINWDSGEASGGNSRCIGGTAARAGYTDGLGDAYQLPGSGIDNAFLNSDWSSNGLVHDDRGSSQLGRYIFAVRSGHAPTAAYVALGDSYSSGEGTGNFSYSSNHGDGCDRGPYAWPIRMHSLAPSVPSITSASFYACSGASSNDILNVREPGEPATQLQSLSNWVSAHGSPSLVTVTAGGDDQDRFKSTLSSCWWWGPVRCVPMLNNYLSYLRGSAEVATLRNVFSQIKSAAGDGAQVVAVGYPAIFPAPSFWNDVIADERCAWFNDDATQLLPRFQQVQSLLDQVELQAANAAGVRFVSTRTALAGHELCSNSPEVNSIGLHAGLIDTPSGHPLAAGQDAIARSVASQLGYYIPGGGGGGGAGFAPLRGGPSAVGAKGKAVTGTPQPAARAGMRMASNTSGVAPSGSGLSIDSSSLPDGTVGSQYVGFIPTAGGSAPYTYSVQSGALPPGLNLDSSQGVISGSPTSVGTFNFTVEVDDSAASTATADFSITIDPVPVVTIPTSSLPQATVNQPYQSAVEANGGFQPYTFALTSGALPGGLTLDPSTGTISGTPTTTGTATFTVTATDSAAVPTTSTPIALSINTVASTTALNITTSAIASAMAGVDYSAQLTSIGGTAPILWSVTTGALPDGVTLDPVLGTISGVPTADGTYSFAVAARDSGTVPAFATRNLTLTVASPNAPQIDPAGSLPTGQVGASYEATLGAEGGVGPYTWSISAGALPDGLTIDSSSGLISGAPTTSGTYDFTVELNDARTPTSQSASIDLEIVIADAPANALTVTDTVGDAVVQSPYDGTIIPVGGTAPFSFAVTDGALPAGLSLDPVTGEISGTPTDIGSYDVTVGVTDSSTPANTATDAVSITVAAPDPLTITSTGLSTGSVGSAYADAIGVSGGTEPYAFTVSGGSLPDGLAIDSTTGVISGTPTSTGSSTFDATVTDAASPTAATATYTFTITIGAAEPVIVTTTDLPDAQQGTPYAATLEAENGAEPYTWSVSQGSLPDGLTLDQTTGVISGTPTGTAAAPFTVSVADATTPAAEVANATLSMNIVPAPAPTVVTAALPLGSVGSAYDATLESSGGVAPIEWSVSAGPLPDGLFLDPSGEISGTPTTAGVSHLVLSISDGSTPDAQVSTEPITLEVTPGATASPVTLTSSAPTAFPGQTVNFNASISLPGASSLKGTVGFYDAGTLLATKPVKKGAATFATKKLDVGDHGITAMFTATGASTGISSAVLDEEVDPAPTQITVVSTVNPSTFTQNVVFKATVKRLAPASGPVGVGTITFFDNGSPLRTMSAPHGAATFATKTLGAGEHDVTAEYDGGASDQFAYTPNVLVENVAQAATTDTVKAAPVSLLHTKPVTLTATVSLVAPAHGKAAEGSVDFFDDGTYMCTVAVTNGVASFRTILDVGVHDITASYSGGANTLSSNGGPVAVTVR